MSDLVAEYLRIEHDLLTHRLRRTIAGIPRADEDPAEDRFEAEFDRVWDAMGDEQRADLRWKRDARILSPAERPVAAAAPGGRVVHIRSLRQGIELTVAAATPLSLRRPAAAMARVILDHQQLEEFPGGARLALIENGLALVGCDLDDARARGGMQFVDPETGEVLLAVDAVASGVAERPEGSGDSSPLVYRAGNATSGIRIEREPLEELRRDPRARKYLVSVISGDADHLLAVPAETAMTLLPPWDVTDPDEMKESWSGKAPTSKSSHGHWVQPFLKDHPRFAEFIVERRAFLLSLGDQVELIEFRKAKVVRHPMTTAALGQHLARESRIVSRKTPAR